MVRAMRLLNSIEAGTTTGAQLEAQLVNGGVQSDFNSIMQLPGQCTVLAASITALTAINLSPIATNLTAVGVPSNFALSRNSTARAFLFSTATNLLTACVVAAPQNWYPYGTWTRAFGAGLNNVLLGSTSVLGNFVAFGNGVYVTTSGTTSRDVYTSTDGVTWTVRTNALPVQAGGRWMGVRFGNGVFIAVSGGSATSTTAATSTNGITWTTQTLPLAEWTNLECGLVSATFTWVAISGGVGANSTVTARSTDNGATWTAGGALASSRWCAISFINGVFITVPGVFPYLSSQSLTTAYRSINGGTSWTAVNMSAASNWTGVAAVPGTPTRWIAVNSGGNNFGVSTDSGVTWTDFAGTADGGTGFIIASGNALVTYNKFSNTAGTTFTTANAVSNTNNISSCSAIFANGFVRNLGPTSPRLFSYSQLNPDANGFFYGFDNSFKPTCTLTVGTTFYQFGYGGYYSSTDQTTWTFTQVPAFTTQGGPVSVATNGTGTFIAVFGGANGATAANNQFARSTNSGVTWTFVTVTKTAVWTSIAFGNGNFFAVSGLPNPSINGGGATATDNEGVYSTDNGATWVTSSLTASSGWSHVAFLNSSFVTVGNAANIFYSTNNGTGAWTSGIAHGVTTARQIAFTQVGSQNVWCVVGSTGGGANLSSSTGALYPVTSLTNTAIGETQMSSITANNGYFFAATNYATGNSIYSSVNGVTWTRTALPTTAVFPSNFLRTTGSTGVVYYNTTTSASILGTYNI